MGSLDGAIPLAEKRRAGAVPEWLFRGATARGAFPGHPGTVAAWAGKPKGGGKRCAKDVIGCAEIVLRRGARRPLAAEGDSSSVPIGFDSGPHGAS